MDGRVEPQRHTVHCNLVSICRESGSYLERFPKIRGTLLRVPKIGIIVFWGLYWGPLILGNYHLERFFLDG